MPGAESAGERHGVGSKVAFWAGFAVSGGRRARGKSAAVATNVAAPLDLADPSASSPQRERVSTLTMPLRITHVVNEPLGPDGASGVQQVVYCVARAQTAGGHGVFVLSRSDGPHVLADGPARSVAGSPPLVRRDGRLRRWVLNGFLERGLAGHIEAWRPHIVHFHSIHIPENIALAAYLDRLAIPYCITVHGGLFPPALRRSRLKKAVLTHLCERRYLNGARFIHAVSPHETEVIRAHGVDRPVLVVPNGVPSDADIRSSDPDRLFVSHPVLRGRRIFLFVGRLDPWQKGLDVLVEAFAAARLRGAALVLAGPDRAGSRRRLASLARQCGAVCPVLLMDPVFGVDRANLFAAATFFVHPSRWEGLSLSVLAAAAAAKPCLLTRQADPLGALERAGAAVIVGASVREVADGLRQMNALEAKELDAMGARARQVAEAQFTWESIAARLVDGYRGALAASSHADARMTQPSVPRALA